MRLHLLLSAVLLAAPAHAQVLGYFGPDNTTETGIKNEQGQPRPPLPAWFQAKVTAYRSKVK
ncbi:hypothetical protein B1R32_12921 [Abditibacterium utsteinense]|uniref:Uncharacterized protein n=1 Tax=Abditibacterium utsteinense TaxID=1960156 RepID=A0A2S8SP41_9BACT|nr:hypothetical protein B1R32_12921 [Abditibacterium utsteinense]